MDVSYLLSYSNIVNKFIVNDELIFFFCFVN